MLGASISVSKSRLLQAQAFLTMLDECADSWTFQTFDDSNVADRSLVRQFHGDLDQHADELARLNELGAGVFVTINETDGRGRRKENITRVRALFVDLDGAPLGPVQATVPVPHIITETSPGRYHALWRVTDCSKAQCEPALKQLIRRYHADTACCDISRVLRLPGFFHRKREPHMVNLIESSPGECRVADFGFENLEVAKPTEESRRVQTQFLQSSLCSSVGADQSWPLPMAAGERNRRLFEFARYLKGVMPDATLSELRPIVAEWHRRALPVIATKDFSVTWADFVNAWGKVKVPHGAILEEVIEKVRRDGGVPPSVIGLGYGEKGNLLVRICRQLQKDAGDGLIFISSRKAGELVGMHYTDAARALQTLCVDGVLKLVSRGVGRVASRYRYIWPE